MKKEFLRFTLYVLIVYLTGPTLSPAVAAPQPLVGNGTHFCGGVIDYPSRFHWGSKQPDNRRYAQAPAAAALNAGEPYTVRLIYFRPSDVEPLPSIDADMDALIKVVQRDYANDMERHGFGRKTFTFETDTTGKAVVHHVNGQASTAYYQHGTFDKVSTEIGKRFDLSRNIYLTVVDGSAILESSIGGRASVGQGSGGVALVYIGGKRGFASPGVASHELRHAFGLLHDYRVSVDGFTYEISKCTAEFLDVHRYFNAPRQSPDLLLNTRTQMFPPSLVSPPNTIRLRFKVVDSDGLYQAQLQTPEVSVGVGNGGGFLGCKRLTGTSSVVEFVTTGLTPRTRSISLNVIDVYGNVSWSEVFPIDITSLLPPPEIVSIPEANLAAAVRQDLRLAPGDTLTAHTMLELRYLDVMGITDLTGLKHAINLRWLLLRFGSISDISVLAGLTNLSQLRLRDNSISDISALGGLTQLKRLHLFGNSISDISALGGLTQLIHLQLQDNSISDISALGGLANLIALNLANNSVSDISSLVANTGLGDGDTVDVRGNPLSYLSLHTHIPALQSRGVTVEFDNRAHPALLKISGNNQKGTAFVPLSNPYVVEVQDENGDAAAGISVTFAVTAGGGIIHPEINTTDENGRAESTLTLGPNLGTNTVSVSATGIVAPATFQAVSDNLPTEYLLSVPAGVSLIHVPLKVRTVNGVAQTITSVTDLYDALGGADTVNLLITRDSTTQRWHSYLGASSRGTAADPVLTDDTGIVAFMNLPVSLRLSGGARGTNGNSLITLHPGTNLVGVPLRDLSVVRVKHLFGLDGIGGNVSTITVLDNGEFQTIRPGGSGGDILITGGQSFIFEAQAAATVIISGGAWYNTSEIATGPPPPIPGIEVGDATPVLALSGSIVGEGIHANREGFHVIVKNLSTGREVTTVIGDENLSFPDKGNPKVTLNSPIGRVGYQVTVVDVETGEAVGIEDILEISAPFPDTSIRVQPLQYTVTAEDVLRSRIELRDLVTYEILWETELLQNYPNPFTPETWIPYRLAADAFVTLTIYDQTGHIVRTLEVGHQIAAAYENRSKAVYWDGRNGLGEPVASGVYFYHLSTGDFSATRKMVILK